MAGMVNTLVRLLDSPDTAVQREAAWALGHWAAADAAKRASIVSAGAVPLLVSMLGSPDTAVQRDAASALGHLAEYVAHNKARIVRAGAILPLVCLLDGPATQCKAAWTLGILAGGDAANKASIVSAGAVPVLMCLLSSPDTAVQHEAASALCQLAADSAANGASIARAGAVHVEAAGIQAAAARAVQADDQLPPPLHTPRSIRPPPPAGQLHPAAPSTPHPTQPYTLAGGSVPGSSIADFAQSLLDSVSRWPDEHLRANRQAHIDLLETCVRQMRERLGGLWIDPHQLELGHVMGEGGFAVVLQAKQAPGGQQVALNQFHVFTPLGRTKVQSFVKEACLLSQLQHKNIVALHHFTANLQSGWLGIVLEWAGDSLAAKLVEEAAGQLVITPQERLEWAIGIVEGLQYMHGRSPCLVHRDLTISNIVIDKDNQAKLIDFGISQVLSHTHLTVNRAGCPAWMAPELLHGEEKAKGHQVFSLGDKTSDIYSLGLCLCAMATHCQPWDGHDASLAFRDGARLGVPDVPQPWLQQLVQRCMSETPDHRPAIEEVLRELRQHRDESMLRAPAGMALGAQEAAWPVYWPE